MLYTHILILLVLDFLCNLDAIFPFSLPLVLYFLLLFDSKVLPTFIQFRITSDMQYVRSVLMQREL